MFDWFSSGSSGAAGLDRMRAEFCQMLDAGRQVFEAATDAMLGKTDPEAVRESLFKTEKKINKSVRHLRREIVVHSTVHGAGSFPACLVLMSIVKDAERIGDYRKNLFDLATTAPIVQDNEWKTDIAQLTERIASLLSDCRDTFSTSDRDKALALISRAETIEDRCDDQIHRILTEEPPKAASYVLAYRYLKRVASHVFNVLTSVVQPVDRLDFAKKLPIARDKDSGEASKK